METTINTKKIRKELSETLNRVKYTYDRVTITKYGKPVAAIIPIEDLKFLEEIEEELDRKAIEEAWEEQGDEPLTDWEEFKRELEQ